jgi:L-iditol 2-dehydrogenase
MCGICGTDKHGYKGESIQYAGTPREVSGPYPAIPGHEIVAKVVKLSSRNGEAPLDFYGSVLAEGDRIVVSPDILCGKCYWCRHTYGYTWCDNIRSYGHMDSSVAPHLFGGWSEMMYLYPESHVFKISDDVPDEIAVLAEPMAVTYAIDIARGQSALPNQGLLSGDTVVILGVGPLGICHLIKSRLTGAGKIVAVDRSEYRLEMSRDFGANHTLDVTITSLEERLKLVQEVTDGRGADMVIECTGVPAVFIEGIDLLRQGGTFVEVGHFVDSGDVKLNPHRHICAKNIRMIGQTNLAYTGLIPSIKLLMANRDKYNFQQLTTHRFHFSRAEEALKTAMGLESMKVVITSD